LIRVDPAISGTQDSEDELDENDEDDCETDKALIQKLKESINKLSFEIYKKQGESVTEIKRSYDFVNKVLSYWNHFSACQRKEIHPTHKTPDEKRLRRNKKARDRRNKS
jgi:hypothetical protein